MASRAGVWSRILALLMLVVPLVADAQTRQFTLVNNCSETVWVAGAGNPVPVFNGTAGGAALAPGESVTTSVTTPWVGGRFWGRRQCVFDSNGKGSCATGDCGGLLACQHAGAGNTSLAEFTLTGSSTGSDNYDISQVDAFDFPLSVQLNDANPAHAINAACQVDLRNSCPAAQQVLNKAGQVVACNSLCGAYGTPNYCCASQYGSPQACNNVHWDTNYRGSVLKNSCPSVYGYAFDDPSSDFNVAPPPAQGYTITFCPANTVPNANPVTSPTFTIAAQETSETVAPGNSVAYHLNITAGMNFSGTVKLSAAHLPGSCTWTAAGKVSCSAAGSSASFDKSSVLLMAGESVPVVLTVKTTANPAPMLGTGNLEVIGQSGAIENVWEGSLTVADPTAPDYTLSVTPSTPSTVKPGTTVTYNATITPLNGFSGTVSLLSYGTPSGTATFSVPQMTFTGGAAPQTTTLTLATSTSATQKTYHPLITTFSSNRLHDFQTALTLGSAAPSPDFTPSVSPATNTVVAGGAASYTIQAQPLNGFTGVVSLSAAALPEGVTASFSPQSISGTASSMLTLATSASTLPGNYTVQVVAASGALSHTFSVALVVNAASSTSPQQPIDLADIDVGDPTTPGNLQVSGETFTVSGSGSDIFGDADQFNYANEALSGDFTIIARVISQTGTDEWAKGGVMIRATTAADSISVGVFATPKHGAAMIVRTATGGGSLDLGQVAVTVPAWVKLQRSGNTFSGFASTDGVNWKLIATHDAGMPAGVTAGLAVTSKRESTLNVVTFDNISIQ